MDNLRAVYMFIGTFTTCTSLNPYDIILIGLYWYEEEVIGSLFIAPGQMIWITFKWKISRQVNNGFKFERLPTQRKHNRDLKCLRRAGPYWFPTR